MFDFGLTPEWAERVTAIAGDGPEGGLSDEEVREIVSTHFEHQHRSVHRFLAYACPDPGDAEDLTQETFIRLFRAVRDGKTIENVRRWLFTVARRVMLDHLEACRRRDGTVELPADADDWIAGSAATPEEALIASTAVERFHAAIGALPPLQRDCLYLRGQGLRLREIGEILERNPRRVAEILGRATASLRRGVAEEIDFEPGMDLFAFVGVVDGKVVQDK